MYRWQAIELARAIGEIALPAPVFQEITSVLERPKFARVLTEERRHEILELLTAAARWATPTAAVTDCRDAKDNCYLELAAATQASAIVSGDDDLLVLDPWRGILVLRPAAYLSRFRGQVP